MLVPLYIRDRADWFAQALVSVQQQTHTPDQVVVAVDGPLTPAQERVLSESGIADALTVVRLPTNQGAGAALQAGMAACSDATYVARLDADDVMAPERLERQVAVLEDDRCDFVGSWLAEFDADTERMLGIRQLPTGSDEIAVKAHMVNPLAGPATTWKASTIERAGGFRNHLGHEDYDLTIRALRQGSRALNLPEALTFYRSGDRMYRRRGGRGMIQADYALQRELYRTGYLTRLQFAQNIPVRLGFRVLPWRLKKWYYERTLAPAGAKDVMPRG